MMTMPPTLKTFKDWVIEYIEDLVRETGYDYFELQDRFMEIIEFVETDEEFREIVTWFTNKTLEKGW